MGWIRLFWWFASSGDLPWRLVPKMLGSSGNRGPRKSRKSSRYFHLPGKRWPLRKSDETSRKLDIRAILIPSNFANRLCWRHLPVSHSSRPVSWRDPTRIENRRAFRLSGPAKVSGE